MLVLSRKKSERIYLDRDIVIQVVEIKGDKVRLGIVAPQSVKVFREELLGPQDDGTGDNRPR